MEIDTLITFINRLDNCMHGSMVTINDYYTELSRIYPSYIQLTKFKPKYNIYDEYIDSYKQLRKYIGFKDAVYPIDYNTHHPIVITSFYTIPYIDLNKLHGNVLILLDALEVSVFHSTGILGEYLDTLAKQFKYIYLPVNPFNNRIIKKYHLANNISLFEYYTKLSKSRVDKYGKDININAILIRDERLKEYYTNYYLYNDRQTYLNTLQFTGYAFCRISPVYTGIYEGVYIENIGKLIFEYLYLNRTVDYYPYRKHTDDGLHYYLQLFGIDDNIINIDISVDHDKLVSKMILQPTDDICKIIEEHIS